MNKPSEDVPKDCLACRMVGGFGCIAASIYVGFNAKKNTSQLGRGLTFLFAGALGGLGLSRLFNVLPLNRSNKEESQKG